MTAFRINTILLVVLVVASVSTQAQIIRIDTVDNSNVKIKSSQYKTSRLYMYTIGLKAFSYEEFPKILNQTNANNLVTTVVNGVFVKLNDNQISYRIATNFYKQNITFKNECEDCEEAKGQVKDFSARVGFEKNFVYGMLQPYFAFDIGYRRNAFKGDVANAGTLNYSNPYEVNTLKNGLSLSPNFGLKFTPVSHFTFSIESGIGLLYSYEKQERVSKDINRTRSFSQYNKWEFLLRPVSMATIQYNFGLAY
ncbi:MAG: hypothetical protein H7Y13_05535 [Sphingobacteriaceae bacterium]|nr:hypothetical protein [Sphingobacteriaceae bacterium]